VSYADKSRYFGKRKRDKGDRKKICESESKREGKRERGKEEKVWSVVISLVKADLLCEFLISVHLLVVPPHRVRNVAHTCYNSYTSTRVHISEGKRIREAEQSRKGLFSLKASPLNAKEKV